MAAHSHRQCCCTVRACSSCSPSPTSVIATVSGITLCTSCLPLAGGGHGVFTATASTDGTYALTQDAVDPCLWVYRARIGLVFTHYSGAGCTGSVVDVRDYFAIRFNAAPLPQSVIVGMEPEAYIGGTASLLYRTGFTSCSAPFTRTFTSIYTSCPFPSYGNIGYGGSVVITAT